MKVLNKKQFLQAMKDVGFSRSMRVQIFFYWEYERLRDFISRKSRSLK